MNGNNRCLDSLNVQIFYKPFYSQVDSDYTRPFLQLTWMSHCCCFGQNLGSWPRPSFFCDNLRPFRLNPHPVSSSSILHVNDCNPLNEPNKSNNKFSDDKEEAG